jgi:ABC-type transport system involved in cytochrome c biogenesis permease subunit
MTLFRLSMRGMRDGALLGVLLYCIAYATFMLRTHLMPHVGMGTLRDALDFNNTLIATIGMAGAGYFILGGAALGAIPWGSMFGHDPKRKKA